MPLQVAERASAYGRDADTASNRGGRSLFCNVCSHQWTEGAAGRRFRSLDDLIKSTGLRRDEVTVLAEVGALNSLGYDRRSALWQVERAVRPAGELLEEQGAEDAITSPLPEMSAGERLVADYAGTGLTVGPHPMRFRRHELSMKGVLRAIDLPLVKSGRRVRTAGMVITRQRPGTAKGFVFLTLEDETGISNVIIRPDVYARDKAIVVESPFLLVEGWLQIQDGVTAIKAERLQRLDGLLASMAVESHDFR
jgi:error-prone DNA polymerase